MLQYSIDNHINIENMEQIEALLQSIGLTDTEAHIYLTGLAYPTIEAGELSKLTKIKRTTVYHALGTLLEKGLVAKKRTLKGLGFIMTSPDRLRSFIDNKIDFLKQQQTAIKGMEPLLEKYTKSKEPQTWVMHYEGIEGIKVVIEYALYAKSRQWDIIAPVDNFFKQFDKSYAQYFLKTRKENNIKARSLWEKDVTGRTLSRTEAEMRNPRLLPQSMWGKFKSVIILFDNKVAFISSLKDESAVLIQSEEIYRTHAAMFESLWQASLPYPAK